ncbi:MAG: cytochrome c [Maritimibacter sp.]|nr:cytochrome c [Maritimibacter sp.]
MKAKYILPLFLAVTASAALGHGGVQNAAVLARMEAMKAIGDATKVLGEMAKGAVAFDANAARAAAETIATHAADTPALFEAREADPKSEAKPGIWENFADFTAKAKDLEGLAGDLATGLDSPEPLRAGLGQLGDACKACHTEYRE